MTDSAAAYKAEAVALANGPAPPGAYNNKMGFDEYALHDQVEYCMEVGGVLVGYAGHVPRARDKVGSCPIGNTPGTPVSPNGAVGIDMETGIRVLPHDRVQKFPQSFTRMKPEPPNKYVPGVTSANYSSEARDPQNKSNLMKPSMFEQGTTPGYTGHVARVKTHSLGASTFSTPPPGSSVFVGKWMDPSNPASKMTLALRTNAKGHHAVQGDYKLATIVDENANTMLVAIKGDDILIDFQPIGGPPDFPGKFVGDGIGFPNGMKWVKWVPSAVWDDGTGGM